MVHPIHLHPGTRDSAWDCSLQRRYPSLFRRIVVGFSAGLFCTLCLDGVRQAGVLRGWLPGDTPVMFGKMATGSSTLAIYWPAGLAVHYLNGANFSLFYAFVWGKRTSSFRAALLATGWALIIEMLMMTGPPMAPMVGLFGVNFAWPQLFLITFVAHVFFGEPLGLLIQHFQTDEDRDWLIPFLLKRRSGNGEAGVTI
ncbi:MAG: hypothetical protein IT422_25210 [Pirellulaceae bacterium]|nr:hypothetical protein [Pirellulaceae bacterium]